MRQRPSASRHEHAGKRAKRAVLVVGLARQGLGPGGGCEARAVLAGSRC